MSSSPAEKQLSVTRFKIHYWLAGECFKAEPCCSIQNAKLSDMNMQCAQSVCYRRLNYSAFCLKHLYVSQMSQSWVFFLCVTGLKMIHDVYITQLKVYRCMPWNYNYIVCLLSPVIHVISDKPVNFLSEFFFI